MPTPSFRRAAAALAVAWLAAASAADASTIAVGAKQVIYTASQRQSLGLSFWPDGNLGVAPAANGQIHFYAANSSTSVRTTGTLGNPAASRQNITIAGLPGGFNYVAGGPVYHDAATGARLLLYHAEKHLGSAQNYYTTLGLAVARDASGLVFDDLGLIIEPNIPTPVSHAIDVGGGSLTVLNGDLYVHYRDYLVGGGSSELAVARAPLATVLSNAAQRQGTAFTKYYNGAWSQPGRGGLSSPLETGNPINAWSSVAYNEYLNGFVMVSAQRTAGDMGNLYLATSADGVVWSPRQAIAIDPGEQFYPSIVGKGSDPARTGQSFYVYYTDSAAGGWNRWNDAELARREITLDPAPGAPPVPSNEWTTVAAYAADFQSGAPATGWNYLWNPTRSTNPATFVSLKWSNVAGAYNTTGAATPVWSGGKGRPDDYLALAAWGGHPGQPGYNAIASYTIQPEDGAGLYRLANSAIMKVDAIASPGEDPLNVLVFVNGVQRGASSAVPVSGAGVNFDRDLGQLAVGDTIYVMASAGANQNYDGFKGFDFAIQKSPTLAPPVVTPPVTPPVILPPVTPPPASPPPVVPPPVPPPPMEWVAVADFRGEFRPGSPAPGWKYLWNPTGKLGNAAAFVPLQWSNVADAYNTTGGATTVWSSGKSHPDDYLMLAAWGGHPGRPGYNVIVGYTIQTEDGAGEYRLAAASLMKLDTTVSPGEDGLTLAIYVNNALRGPSLTVDKSGAPLSFHRDLGQLAVGDTVYVVIGAGANQNFDSFKNFNFTLERLMPPVVQFAAMAVPEPSSAALLAVMGAVVRGGRRRMCAARTTPSLR